MMYRIINKVFTMYFSAFDRRELEEKYFPSIGINCSRGCYLVQVFRSCMTARDIGVWSFSVGHFNRQHLFCNVGQSATTLM